MTDFKRVGLLGRREHPGVAHVVAELLDLLDGRAIDAVLEDRLATLAHFETRAMQPRDAIGAKKWLEHMFEVGVKPDVYSFNGVISAFAKQSIGRLLKSLWVVLSFHSLP